MRHAITGESKRERKEEADGESGRRGDSTCRISRRESPAAADRLAASCLRLLLLPLFTGWCVVSCPPPLLSLPRSLALSCRRCVSRSVPLFDLPLLVSFFHSFTHSLAQDLSTLRLLIDPAAAGVLSYSSCVLVVRSLGASDSTTTTTRKEAAGGGHRLPCFSLGERESVCVLEQVSTSAAPLQLPNDDVRGKEVTQEGKESSRR